MSASSTAGRWRAPDRVDVPHPADRARDRRGGCGRHRGDRKRRPAPGPRRSGGVRAQERARHQSPASVPLVIAPSASVSLQPQGVAAARIAPESVDLISPRLSLFYSEDGRSRSSSRLAGRAPPRASAPSCRPGAARPRRRPRRASARGDRALGRIDLIKMLSETSAARGDASMPVPTCARSA